jgi:methionyl-tRNA formyltransferase
MRFEGNRIRAKGIGILLAVFPAASHLTYAAFTAPPAFIRVSSDMLFRPRMAGGGVGFGRPAVCILPGVRSKRTPNPELSALVSNPPAPAGRKKQLTPSPVQALAEAEGIPVFIPTGLLKKFDDSAEFLESMRNLAPDLCITAEYGQFLPEYFLAIPKYGTLAAQFRGASPVPRALEEGVDVTGVTVLFTVFEMDAGPIAAQTQFALKGRAKADELLPVLFDMGTDLLLNVLPEVFAGSKRQDGVGCVLHCDDKANTLVVTCDDGSQLDVLEIQPPGKKRMDAKSFWNGMQGRHVERARVPWSPGYLPAGSLKNSQWLKWF